MSTKQQREIYDSYLNFNIDDKSIISGCNKCSFYNCCRDAGLPIPCSRYSSCRIKKFIKDIYKTEDTNLIEQMKEIYRPVNKSGIRMNHLIYDAISIVSQENRTKIYK